MNIISLFRAQESSKQEFVHKAILFKNSRQTIFHIFEDTNHQSKIEYFNFDSESLTIDKKETIGVTCLNELEFSDICENNVKKIKDLSLSAHNCEKWVELIMDDPKIKNSVLPLFTPLETRFTSLFLLTLSSPYSSRIYCLHQES